MNVLHQTVGLLSRWEEMVKVILNPRYKIVRIRETGDGKKVYMIRARENIDREIRDQPSQEET